jgi:protein-disulfide isomerase
MNGSSMLLSLAAALSLLACQAPPVGANQGADSAAKSDATAAQGDGESCTTLATKICDQAGAESSTCASVKKTTSLISANTCAVALADIDYTMQQLAAAGQPCADLSKRLCADLGPESSTCKMVQDQTPQMPGEQCEQMLDQYDKVLADLQQMEARNKPLEAEAIAKIAAGDVPSYGPEDATVTVVEFSDFECPYCSLAAAAVDQAKEKYGDRVRFVFRQFPLSFHQQAHLAAQASLAAHAQGKFWEFHDKLFANQKQLGRDALEGYAKELGLDMDAFNKALDDGTYKDTVDAELALGQEVFVQGTPTMFVNGARVSNSTDAATVSAAIDAALGATPGG